MIAYCVLSVTLLSVLCQQIGKHRKNVHMPLHLELNLIESYINIRYKVKTAIEILP